MERQFRRLLSQPGGWATQVRINLPKEMIPDGWEKGTRIEITKDKDKLILKKADFQNSHRLKEEY